MEARDRIDRSVRSSSFEISRSDAPIRILSLRTSSSAVVQSFPLFDTIAPTSAKKGLVGATIADARRRLAKLSSVSPADVDNKACVFALSIFSQAFLSLLMDIKLITAALPDSAPFKRTRKKAT